MSHRSLTTVTSKTDLNGSAKTVTCDQERGASDGGRACGRHGDPCGRATRPHSSLRCVSKRKRDACPPGVLHANDCHRITRESLKVAAAHVSSSWRMWPQGTPVHSRGRKCWGWLQRGGSLGTSPKCRRGRQALCGLAVTKHSETVHLPGQRGHREVHGARGGLREAGATPGEGDGVSWVVVLIPHLCAFTHVLLTLALKVGEFYDKLHLRAVVKVM